MHSSDIHIATTLGLLLFASLLAGVVAEYVRLPKVTAYLLAGLLLGPGVTGLVPLDQVHTLDPMLKFSMALILFGLGGQFPLNRVRRILPKALLLSAGELTMTFLLVSAGLTLVGLGARQSVILGCLALATAPATTVFVLKELKSEGPVTELCAVLVAINNFVAIIAFELVFVTIQVLEPGSSAEAWKQAAGLAFHLLSAILFGTVAGVIVAYGCGLLGTARWLALLVAMAAAVLGLCESFEIPYMLAFLAMGLTTASLSDLRKQILRELNHVSGLLAVLFFAMHGTELDPPAFAAAGTAGLAYILLRSGGKILGVSVAARLSHQPVEVQRWLGPTLIAQAGTAIALATLTVSRAPGLGRLVQTVVLGSVVVFEIIGPLLIRQAVLHAGEVPLLTAINKVSSSPFEKLRELWDNFLIAIRWRSGKPLESGIISVSSLLRRNAEGIRQTANFDAVVSHIEHSRDNTWPVVNDKGHLVGVIRFRTLSEVLFTPEDRDLIRAEDLAMPADTVLFPDDPIERAGDFFRAGEDDALPVVGHEEFRPLLGIIRRSDVMHILIQRQGRLAENSTRPGETE